jgi:hypothetical protein
VQVELQVRDLVPPVPQLAESVAPAAQTPSPVHAPHAPHPVDSQVRVLVPQLPHALESTAPSEPHDGAPPMHSPYEPQLHEDVQVREWVPPLPQLSLSVADGLHSPSPLHALQSVHFRSTPQVCDWVPQFPQGEDSLLPGTKQEVPEPCEAPVSLVDAGASSSVPPPSPGWVTPPSSADVVPPSFATT